jgi:hypothetical protein
MDVKITLLAGYSSNVNNFTIYYTVSGGSPAVAASNITALQLAAGYTISVPETTTGGTVNSTGVCTSYDTWTVSPCYKWDVDISQTDINDATGNTGGLAMYNNVVLIDYTDCGGTPDKYLGAMAGQFDSAFCAKDSEVVSNPYYYKNNSVVQASNSSATETSTFCS